VLSIDGLGPRRATWTARAFLWEIDTTDSGGARAAGVPDFAPLDEGAEMIGCEAGFASSFGE
jgi:hypothetical protein